MCTSTNRITDRQPMWFVATFVVCFCCLASGAIAEEIPEYDIQALCEQRAGPDTASNRRFASCLAIQDYALAELDDYWPEANETDRLECIDEASPTKNYVVLASCLMARVREQRR